MDLDDILKNLPLKPIQLKQLSALSVSKDRRCIHSMGKLLFCVSDRKYKTFSSANSASL